MSEDVINWLNEIRQLKQQISDLQKERDELNSSANKWRDLYSQEAKQRRSETRIAQEEQAHLKKEIDQLQRRLTPSLQGADSIVFLQEELSGLTTPEALRHKLIEVIAQRNQALEALKQEQINHDQTRKSLTAVISDTVDQLSKYKTPS